MTEIDKDARKRQTIVYAFGKPLAYQRVTYQTNPATTTETVSWEVRDPSGTTVRGVNVAELDPDGMNVGLGNPDIEHQPEVVDPDNYWHPFIGGGGGSALGSWGCQMDGINVPCSVASGALGSGGAVQCPNNDCGYRWVQYNGTRVAAYFHAFADGYSGFVPNNANYIGGGQVSPVGGQRVNNYIFAVERMALGRLMGVSAIDSGEFNIVMAFTGIDNFWQNQRNSVEPSVRKRQRLDENLLSNLRDFLEIAIGNSNCKDFLDKYAGAANLLEVFDLVKAQGGFAFNNINGGGQTSGAVVKNKVGTGVGAGIDFNPGKYGSVRIPVGNNGTGLIDTDLAVAMVATLIHELIHASNSSNGDVTMRDRLAADGKALRIPPGAVGDSTFLASMQWAPALDSACKPDVATLFGGQ